jgi:hypothetical protein
LEAQLYFIHQT